MRFALVSCLLLGGCSFPGGAYVEGSLIRLDVPVEAGAGQPITLRAHAAYAQRYKDPVLTIHLPTDGSTEIKVGAVAGWLEPPMGLGIFARLPFAAEADLVGSFTCDKPGTYTVTGGQLEPKTVAVR